MLILLILLLWNLSVRAYRVLRVWAPTNILLDWLRARPGAISTGIALGTGAAYLAAACTLAVLVQHGWPQWLYLLFFLFLVDAGKFGIYGIGRALLGLLHLPARLAQRRRTRRASHDDARPEQEAAKEYAAV